MHSIGRSRNSHQVGYYLRKCFYFIPVISEFFQEDYLTFCLLVRDRFTIRGLRIFRLLLLRRQLEQKQIADLAMLDSKETRSLLYRMLKAGYVHLQVKIRWGLVNLTFWF